MKGEVHARRFRGPHKSALRRDYPIEIPCYTLQGIQTITITPSADELEVRADTNNVAPGTPVTFTPRNWQGRDVEMRVENIIPPDLPPDPTEDDELGVTDPHVLFYPGGGWFSQIGEGPNAGLVYVIDMPVFAMADVHINYPAFEPGSAFLNGQTGPPDYCTSQEVAAMLPKIEAHEGLNLEPDSHVGWFKAKTVELAGPSFEPIVTTDLSSMVEQGTAVRINIDQEALAYSESFDDGHPVEISCEINWNYPSTLQN